MRIFFKKIACNPDRPIVWLSDPEEGERVTKEWVKKTSSRIWRGSLSKNVWKYLSKGAWTPKKNPKPRRQRRSGSASKQVSRQKAQGVPSYLLSREPNDSRF